MVHTPSNGPTMFGHIRRFTGHVRHVFTWILATATVFWSLGLSLLIQVPVAHAAAPSLSGGGPQGGQTNAPTDALIDINSDVQIKASTVTTSTVSLLKCTGTTDAVSCPSTTGSNLCSSVGAVTDGQGNIGRTIRCNLASGTALEASTTYKFSLTTGIQNNSTDEPLAAQVDRLFRTGSATTTNTIPPSVFAFTPAMGAHNVPLNTTLGFEFSKGPEGDMKADASANAINKAANFTLKKLVDHVPTTAVAISAATWDTPRRFVLVTAAALAASSEYEFCVLGNVVNNQSQSLGSPRCSRFETGATSDITAPGLRGTGPVIPANAATGVDRFSPQIEAYFGESMDQTTITVTNVRLCIDAATDGCTSGDTRLGTSDLDIRYEPTRMAAVFGLKTALTASTRYCFEVTTGVKDTAGNAAAANTTNCFTTGSASDSTGPKIQFADADTFKVVAHFNEGLNATDAVNAGNYTLQCPYNSGNGPIVNIAGQGKTLTYKPDFKEVEFSGLGLTPAQACRLTISSNLRDLAGNNFSTAGVDEIADFTILDAGATSGVLGFGGGQQQDFQTGTNFATFWEKPTRAQPRSQVTSATSNWEIEFPVPQALATNSTFLLTFPNGFTLTDAAAVSATTSWMNKDVNGAGPGTTTISALSADNAAKTILITIAHSGTAMGSSDTLRFELSGIVNPGTAASDLRLSIIVKDANALKVGQTITTAPFNIQAGGSLAISGSVYKDTNGDGDKDASEGINNVKVFCDSMGGFTVGTAGGGMMGHQEATTANNGAWSISNLTGGRYGCGLPPDPTNLADVSGGNQWVDVTLESASKTGVDFKFKDLNASGSGAQTLSVTLTGTSALNGKVLDVFCHAGGFDFEFSAPVMKAVTLDANGGGTASMKLQGGKTYQCGVGPHVDFSAFSSGGPPPVPQFDFLPPAMQQVVVPTGSAPTAVTFALIVAGNTITGTVKDGSDTAIANVFVHARPTGCYDATTGARSDCFGGFSQSKSDGTFTLKVSSGTYEVGADAPGLPSSDTVEVSVKTDGTVQQNGTTVTSVALKMAKSSVTISGTVQDESENGIKYAHVNAEKIATGGTCSSFTPVGGHADSPTDSSGNYTLYVSNGTWCVRAFAPSYGEVGTKVIIISGGTSASGQNIKATAADFGTVSGTVTKGGTAASGAFVGCYGSSGGNQTATSSDGTYSLKLKAGTGYTCDGFIHGAGPLTQQTSVTVTASTTTTVNLSMGNPGTVTVTITGIDDAFVDLRDSSGRGQGTSQASSGAYTIKVPAGTYTVRGGGPKYGEMCAGQTVTVTAGGTHAVTCTPPSTLRTVAGRVTDGTSNVEGVTVRFTTSTGKSFSTSTDAKGSTNTNLSISNVPDGTYSVTASKSGYEPATTTASVSGGNLTLSSAIALTKASGTAGTSVTATVTADSTAYSGDARVICTKGSSMVIADIDKTTGTASLPLTNGTWTVKSVGDNGKESSSTTVTVANGSLSGSAPTLALSSSISGYTAKSDTESVTPKSGGLLKFGDLAVGSVSPEVNIPSSTLSTTDSNTGKVDMDRDVTLAAIDPGADQNFVGKFGYEITPKDATGNEIKTLSGDAVIVSIPYTEADVSSAGVDESKLTLAALDETSGTWETFSTTVDTTNNIITAQVTHFSDFGLLGGGSSTSAGSRVSSDAQAATNIKVTSDGSSVTITWTDPSVGSINILRDNNPTAGVLAALGTVSSGVQKYKDTAVQAGKTYKYVLQTDTGRRTVDSDMLTITVTAGAATTPPPAPSPAPSPTPTPSPAPSPTPGGAIPATPAVPGVSPAVPATPPVTAPSVIRGWSCKVAGGCDTKLQGKLKGKILVAPGRSGEAFYVNPTDNRAYFLGRPGHAFNVMRFLSTGMSEADFAKLQAGNRTLVARFTGKIVLRVNKNGEAWYVSTVTLKPIFLGRPADAFRIMREQGLGVSNDNLGKLDLEGEIVTSREGAAAAAPSPESAAPAPAPAPSPAPAAVEPAAPELPVKSILADATLNCGPYTHTMHAIDSPDTADNNIKGCVLELLRGIVTTEFKSSKVYPDQLITKKFGVAPVKTKDEPGYKLYKFFVNGNAVLKYSGYKFEATPPCYSIALQDYRSAGRNEWHVQSPSEVFSGCQ